MIVSSVDHVVHVVPDLTAAAGAFEHAGLTMTARAQLAQVGTETRGFFLQAADAEFYVELAGLYDRGAAANHRPKYVAKADEGGGIVMLAFAAPDPGVVKEALDAARVAYIADEVRDLSQRLICEAIRFDDPRFGMRIAICCYPDGMPARVGRHREMGYLTHDFPIKRLDHLALFAPKLEETCSAWESVLGIPVLGEVRGPGMLIRQMKVGDAIVELLGPDSPDSPLTRRPAGMANMCAFEVRGPLDEAIALARDRGFSPPEAAAGVLPGTRVSTIPAGELSGLALQLLEYV